LPVDEDFNLDSPDGITQEDIDRMNEQADELEKIAENSEKNAEKIKKNLKVFENKSFKEIDAVSGTVNSAGNIGNDITLERLTEIVVGVLEEQEKAKKERKENKSELELAKEARAELESKIGESLKKGEGIADEFMGATSNPIGFAKGKLMSFVGKAGLIGVIIGIVYKAVDMIWKEYMASFKAGGVNDIRKMMEDRDREMAELDDILARRSGRVFFTGDVDLRQGAPQFSNTERMRDQVLRYQALHLGE